MKKIFYSLFAAALLIGAASCNSDDDSSISTSDVTNTVTSGSWRITNFSEDGVDETSHFTGYNFTFSSSNVLTATNGTNNYQGIWSVTDESDDDDSNSGLDFNVYFSAPDAFTDLNEDWDILERTSSKVRLKHVSGGDSSVDFVTFEKN